ncbi:MAG: Ppx/GppA family phosphatase [Alphaproteobacteria bacterium]|nr:Ppx/GppA family phosphatase [Alphaproteobacteria bacterium]MBV9201853.1 Ppx/GppA family phosphatase [Alphaproteobacteria bacterium]
MLDLDPCAASQRIGVIDLGSNSLRLVVFERLGSALFPLFNEKVMCGLGRGIASTGRLNPEGVTLALVNLRRFVAFARAIAVDHLAVLATAAVRDASDGPTFAAEVERQCRVQVKIVDGAEEARLSAAGVLAGIPDADGIVADLGGGSVELVSVGPSAVGAITREVGGGISLPLGPLRLAELADGTKGVAEIVERTLAGASVLRAGAGKKLYLVGGAARAIARLHMDHTQYPLHIIHRYTLPRREAEGFLDIIGRQSRKSLERITTISRKRLDVVPLAALVLRKLITLAGPQSVVFSALGLREGYAYGLISAEDRVSDPMIAGYIAVGRRQSRFRLDGDRLQQWTAPLFPDLPELAQVRHRAASWLSDLAWSEHPDYRAKQAFIRSLTLPFAGSTHADRVFVATALHARYGGPADDPVKQPTRQLLDERATREARTLGLALRLAYTLCAGTMELLSELKLGRSGETLTLNVRSDSSLFVGETVQRRLDAVARSLGLAAAIRHCDRDEP